MILNPKTALAEGWIKNVGKDCVQPNSIDVRIKKLYRIKTEPGLTLGVDEKKLPEWEQAAYDENEFYYIQKFIPYQFECYEYVKLPKNVVLRLHMRSSLNRSGIFIGAGHWDSGFENYVGASIYPFGNCKIQQGARLAQVVFMRADSTDLYTGVYNISEEIK